MLWEKSSTVINVTSTEIQTLIKDLDNTLKAFREVNGYGRGIAAPQIGILERVIFVRMPPDGFCGVLINPEIVWEDDNRIEIWDACFSFPDLIVLVSRAASVKVEYVDEKGNKQILEAGGDLSELLQHEIDHLDGILAVQRAVTSKSFSTRAEWLKNFGAT
jgi:peptide deformylase